MNIGEGRRGELFRGRQLEKRRQDKLGKIEDKAVLYMKVGKSTWIMVCKISSNICVM